MTLKTIVRSALVLAAMMLLAVTSTVNPSTATRPVSNHALVADGSPMPPPPPPGGDPHLGIVS